MRIITVAVALIIAVLPLAPVHAERPPCLPCAGVSVDHPGLVTAATAAGFNLGEDQRLFLRWRLETDGSAKIADLDSLVDYHLTPWVTLVFRTPAVQRNLADFEAEVAEATTIAAAVPGGTYFQIEWESPISSIAEAPLDYAFMLKRASVAIAGANDGARIVTASLMHDESVLQSLFGEEIAAYIDAIALRPSSVDGLRATVALLIELDPGRTVVVDAEKMPEEPWKALAIAAQNAAEGAALTLFEAPSPTPEVFDAMAMLAREFSGDLSFDPYSKPQAPGEAWAFVDGEDLGLRVIVDMADAEDRAEIVFSDRSLSSPVLATPTGDVKASAGRTARGLVLTVIDPQPVEIVKLERLSAADLGGFEDEFQVSDDWQMPVEEILRRLQVFEDAQNRRLRHYEADKTMHLRFTAGEGVTSIEASFAGEFFFERDRGFDWAWEDLYINGVRWRDNLPELPIIEPEKAAALPFEILFTKEYEYSLRKTDVVEGRDCWVVDFKPLANAESGRLFQGTVWIDRELYCRVKTRAIQLGLTGEVISNEETVYFHPLDENGRDSEWDRDSFFLPIRTVGQETQSLLNAAFHVERETLLDNVSINAPGFHERLDEIHQSDVRMVRDTPEGMRYLVQDEDGHRTVKMEQDLDSLFAVGGVYYDDSVDYPLPIAGVNYFSRDLSNTGKQFNLFFAGIMVNANVADPNLFGSKWDAGARLFSFFVPTKQVLYRVGEESENEAVERRSAQLDLFLGRPLGNFGKFSLTYGLRHDAFGRHDDTDEDFVVPKDSFTHSVEAELNFARGGYRFDLQGAQSQRSDWRFWGLPDNLEYDDAQDSYLKWSASLSKSWWLSQYYKLAVEVEHLGGADLDRFSKYDFSVFSDARVGGYHNGLVTASEATGIHVSYGFNIAEAIRFDIKGDAVWASDDFTGLDNELLAGVSLNGTMMGPWQTVINFDIGVPVEGPADGYTVSIAFLRLFNTN